jgi:hypothetical protein
MKRRLSMIALLTVFCAGCATTYEQFGAYRHQPLNPGTPAFVAMPEDGRCGKENYHGSGAITAAVVTAEFARWLQPIHVAERPGTVAENLERARGAGCVYLIVPEILHWEDRATEWSGRPDRLEVRITTFDAATSQAMCSTILRGKSSFWTLGGDQPQDLLTKPIAGYVNGLFRP